MSSKQTEDKKEAIDAVRENYDYFVKHKDEIPQEHQHRFVLVHNKKFVGYFDTENDAINAGIEDYGGIGNFAVQKVNDQPVDLGILSFEVS